jgi:serine/threonine protein kinase
MTPTSRFLKKGTFGCVYTEGHCTSYTDDKKRHKFQTEFISKVTLTDEFAKKELEIGACIMQNVPYFKYHFAPLLEDCVLDIGRIHPNEVEKCNVITTAIKEKETVKSFTSSKIRFVGKNTVGEYLMSKIDNPKQKCHSHIFKPSKITSIHNTNFQRYKKMIECHLHILKGLIKLNNVGIVHYDLKDNNVIYDDVYGVPIIIDFGLSFKKPLSTSTYKEFYRFDATYPPWTIEIVFINYLVNESVRNAPNAFGITSIHHTDKVGVINAPNAFGITSIHHTDKVGVINAPNAFGITSIHHTDKVGVINAPNDRMTNEEIIEMKGVLETFVNNKNSVFKTIDESTKVQFKSNVETYLNSKENSTKKEFIDELINSTHNSWDNYSIAVMFYFYICDMELDSKPSNDALLRSKGRPSLTDTNAYLEILKGVITSFPNRSEPQTTYNAIQEIVG